MYYYLDSDDGYSRGPFALDELLRLPLAPETFVFNRTDRKWQKLAGLQEQLRARSMAAVRPAARPVGVKARPEPTSGPQTRQKHEPHFPEMHRPQPMPQNPAAPAMGVSGVGCFILALVAAAILGAVLLALF